MNKEHHYSSTIKWTGNKGEGTSNAAAYERAHTFCVEGKADILCSSDTPFRGDGSKHNPEDMFLYSLSSCHMLWYLHLCADAGIIVTDYVDNPKGIMMQTEGGGGYFKEVVLHPIVTITDASKAELANSLHDEAHKKCFIANSCNFPVRHESECKTE